MSEKIAQNPTSGGIAAGALGEGVPNLAQKFPRIVFYAESAEDWAVFYTEQGEIFGVIISKSECPTLQDFKRALRKCEDAPISPEHLVGLKILLVQEVE